MTNNKNSFKEELKNGESLFLEGKIEESQEYFLDLLKKYPSNPNIINNIGAIYHAKGELNSAKECFLKSIEIDSVNLDARMNIINLMMEMNQKNEAIPHLEKILETCDDIDLYNQLGMLFLEFDETEKAYLYLAKSLKIDPEQENIKQLLLKINNHILSITDSNKKNNGDYSSQHSLNTNIVSNRAPKVSIGFLVYNGGEAIRKAIESILTQDYKDFELLISDNASTDQTPDICQEYARMDNRIFYERQEENIGIHKNMLYVFGLARGKYFMWMQHDNWHDPRFISACIDRYKIDDSSTVLVYPRTNLYRDGQFKGVMSDNLKADMDDPASRFRQIVYYLDICNAMLGLFRKKVLAKLPSLYSVYYRGDDHLLLAELALHGKIVQIPGAFLNRELTRNRQMHPEKYNEKLMRDAVPEKLYEGITLPFCRLVYSHLELINRFNFSADIKNMILKDTLQCFRRRFGEQMLFEIERAISLINKGFIYYNWGSNSGAKFDENLITFTSVNINILIRRLLEALIIFPDLSEIQDAITKCSEFINGFQDIKKSGDRFFIKNERSMVDGGVSL